MSEEIYLRGGVYWIRATVKIGGHKCYIRESSRCSTEADAQIVLQRRIAEERDKLQRELTPRERTFAEAAAEYIADLEQRGKDSARSLLDIRMIMPIIGNLPLSHIHQRTLQTWIQSQQGERASATIDRVLRTISTILNFAARVLRDGNTPWLNQAVPKFRSPKWGVTIKPVHLTWEQQDALVNALPQHLVAPVLFAVATGAREHEIVTLKWAQHREFDHSPMWSAWWIPPEIRKSNARKAIDDQHGRFLVCNAFARSVIEAQRGLSEEWVFPSPRTGQSLYRINNHGWRSAVKEAGLKLRVHDLRHTFGLRAADAGIPLDVRRSLLGHTHHDITLHYSSPGLLRLREEVEQIRRPTPTVRDFCVHAS